MKERFCLLFLVFSKRLELKKIVYTSVPLSSKISVYKMEINEVNKHTTKFVNYFDCQIPVCQIPVNCILESPLTPCHGHLTN